MEVNQNYHQLLCPSYWSHPLHLQPQQQPKPKPACLGLHRPYDRVLLWLCRKCSIKNPQRPRSSAVKLQPAPRNGNSPDVQLRSVTLHTQTCTSNGDSRRDVLDGDLHDLPQHLIAEESSIEFRFLTWHALQLSVATCILVNSFYDLEKSVFDTVNAEIQNSTLKVSHQSLH
jgi:hypothetical protein